jgi:hypothetical protein
MAAVVAARLLHLASQPPKGFKIFETSFRLLPLNAQIYKFYLTSLHDTRVSVVYFLLLMITVVLVVICSMYCLFSRRVMPHCSMITGGCGCICPYWLVLLCMIRHSKHRSQLVNNIAAANIV